MILSIVLQRVHASTRVITYIALSGLGTCGLLWILETWRAMSFDVFGFGEWGPYKNMSENEAYVQFHPVAMLRYKSVTLGGSTIRHEE